MTIGPKSWDISRHIHTSGASKQSPNDCNLEVSGCLENTERFDVSSK